MRGRNALRSLTLTLTERCNMRCSYCRVPSEGGRTMRPEVADAAVDLLMQNGNDVTLSFYGGEPFVAGRLMERAIERARAAAGADGKRRLRVLTPTNGLMLSGRTLEVCREAEVDLAISIDGDETASERRFGDGTPAMGKLLPLLPNILALEPRSRVLARMTVTPANVHRFAANVRHVARLGFRRILWQPDYEADWDDDAVAAWGAEHAEIAAWVVRSLKSGVSVPELPALREMEERIVGGEPRRRCGAGGTLAAVSVDGGLYPCYRLVFEGGEAMRPGFGAGVPKPEMVKLGDVERGFTNQAAMDDFGSFDPEAVRPEMGDCDTCVAKDGCTHSCPALGWVMLGDTRRVPAIACRLMIAAVQAIRPFTPLRRRQERRVLERPMAVAMVAMAMTGAGAAVSCGSDVQVENPGGAGGTGETGGNGGMVADAGDGGTIGFGGFAGAGGSGGYSGGGICPVDVDAGMDGYSGGGICPKEADAEPDVWIGPGIC